MTRRAADDRPGSSQTLMFRCNICSTENTVPPGLLAREIESCEGCHSTVRFRSVAAALSVALFGGPAPIACTDFPKCPHIAGIGMSDSHHLEGPFSASFDYENTFLHQEPMLDIMAEVPASRRGAYDFIICSDVIEHVPPPYELALRHCHELLRPGGVLILTVPMKASGGDTDEHFPTLSNYEIATLRGERVLVNHTPSGETELFGDLVFHGGEGETLEMRLIAPDDLVRRLYGAGFEDLRPFDKDWPEFGILWKEPWSWPIASFRTERG